MEREIFNLGWSGLLAAFPNFKGDDHTQDVYYECLRDIPPDWWSRGVKHCLTNNKFFPSISELGKACCPERTGGGRLSAYCYEPEYQIPWQRVLYEHVSVSEEARSRIASETKRLKGN
jgi:hypothetical protein